MTSGEAWLIAIVGGAIATLIATGVGAIFSKTVRDKFWKPIGRALRWPLTLRLTTSTRQAAVAREAAQLREKAETSAKRFREVCDVLDVTPVLSDSTLVPERIQRLQEASADAWAHAKAEVAAAQAHARSQIEATQSLAETQMRDALRINEGQVELARDTSFKDGLAAGRAEAMAEVGAQRAVPALKPVWRIEELGTADAWVLRNAQHSVEVRNVSVDADSGDFVFTGATQSRGTVVTHFEFYGKKARRGQQFGVDFTVKWQDTNGDWWSQVVKVDRDPRRAVFL